MRPIYCANYESGTPETELRGLFAQFGTIGGIIMKRGSVLCVGDVIAAEGFSFVYFEDECDAKDAIQCLRNKIFGKNILRVEWAKGSFSGLNRRPTKTLLVTNLNSDYIWEYDIKRHFRQYGKVDKIHMHQKSAFVRFKIQGNATEALKFLHMSMIRNRVIFVVYAQRDDDDTGGRSDSPRGDYGRRNGASCRSPRTEHRRSRLSHDRGRARSPDFDSRTYPRDRSPDRVRYRRSPRKEHRRSRLSHDRGRARSPDFDSRTYPRDRSPDRVRYRSRSPVRRYHGPSSPRARSQLSPDGGGDQSPDYNRPSYERARSHDRLRDRSRSPVRRYHGPSSPRARSQLSPDGGGDRSPDYNRPSYERARSPDRLRDRRRSPSGGQEETDGREE